VSNAAEAIGEGSGRVTVRTGLQEVRADHTQGEKEGTNVQPGTYVCLQVEDTGSGMSPDTLAQIFDPFFSTKGSGRGLGLSATRGIVRAHKGALLVATAPGEGTRFQVLLPTERQAPQQSSPSLGDRPGRRLRPRGTVLVIDDENAVREVTADMLHLAGIPSSVAEDGETGIARYRRDHDSIELVLLDMQMPGMSGEETMQELRAIEPGVKVVVISGYGESEAMHRFTGSGVQAFLKKPYDFDALMAAIEEVLGPST